MTARTHEYDNSGTYTEYYRDDDNDSGNGFHAQEARWYGPYNAAPAEPEKWYPIAPWSGIDPFDLACERRYD